MSIQWFIFVIFIVVLVQSWIYRKWGLKNIYYSRHFNVRELFQGEEAEMVETITNKKILPLPWVRVESKISSNLQFMKQFNLDIKHHQFHKSFFSLMPYTRITRRHTVKCTKRGYYILNSAALTSGDIFGFQDNSKTFDVNAEILVYPQIISINDIPIPSHSWRGDVTVRRWIVEDPFMVSGVREYAYGDSLKSINWQATARTGKLQVHNRDYTADPNLIIYLNIDISEDMWSNVTEPERIEKGISYAASIAKYAISQGIETGFGTNAYIADEPDKAVRIPARCSQQQLTVLLEAMAKLVIDRRVTFFTFLEEDIKRGTGGKDFLFITSYVSNKMKNQIKKLEDCGNAVEILNLSPVDRAYSKNDQSV